MVVMEHPNGCIHTVKDEDLKAFLNAGWKVKAAPVVEPSIPAAKPKTTKRKTAQK